MMCSPKTAPLLIKGFYNKQSLYLPDCHAVFKSREGSVSLQEQLDPNGLA